MAFTDHEMENLIYEIMLDCATVTPPLERSEIAQHVIDQVSGQLRKEVYASLERMVGRGLICRDADEKGSQPCRYSLQKGHGGKH